jgi:hypothetical protein
MAALTASQAPGLGLTAIHRSEMVTPPGTPIDGGSSYYTEVPPLNTPANPGTSTGAPGAGGTGTGTGTSTATGTTGLPATVLDAYRRAEADIAATNTRCNLRWELLAAIGQVESNQARGGEVDAEGTTVSPILGPVLDGNGFANISDTDGGKWDGDPLHDRAVGPMQFIPSTWNTWGADGNGDGIADPNNIYDAALAAGHYLCADGRDLSNSTDLDRAILGYNHSQAYLDLVRSWYQHFLDGGAVTVPDSGGSGSGSSGGASSGPGNPSASSSPSASASASPSASAKPTKSPTGKPTVSVTGTIKPTPSGTVKPTPSGSSTSGSPTASPTPSDTVTTSPSPSPTCPTGSASPSPSTSTVPTGSASTTGDPCATGSPSPSPSASQSSSPSQSPSVAESASGKL